MACFVIRSLDMYEIESRNRLEDLRHRELLNSVLWAKKDAPAMRAPGNPSKYLDRASLINSHSLL